MSIVTLDGLSNLSNADVGGKAANLNQMVKAGFKVPPAFTALVSNCFMRDFSNGEKYDEHSNFAYSLDSHIRYLAQNSGLGWGTTNSKPPLIVSVRSGAPISMPGMMDTILNIGLTLDNLDNFVEYYKATPEFGLDCYRRLIQMYGVTVKGIAPKRFSDIYDAATVFWGSDLPVQGLEHVINLFDDVYIEETGEQFPTSPKIQLLESCNAVFSSWFGEKAYKYREIEGIDHKMGTSATVQRMVFGNLNPQSATGVVFTHNPSSGVKQWYGDYRKLAQGEDVVAGTHDVQPINDILHDKDLAVAGKALQAGIGKLYQKHRDILDVEFTIENGELWFLQWRIAKRSRNASVRTILDMNREGEISVEEATQRFIKLLPASDLGAQDPGSLAFVGKGLGATDNCVVGKIATNHEQADAYFAAKEAYIYVAKDTAPDDVPQMKNAVGILTSKGGGVCHAVVIARSWDISCVVGFKEITDVTDEGFVCKGQTYESGNLIKINGKTGEVWM